MGCGGENHSRWGMQAAQRKRGWACSDGGGSESDDGASRPSIAKPLPPDSLTVSAAEVLAAQRSKKRSSQCHRWRLRGKSPWFTITPPSVALRRHVCRLSILPSGRSPPPFPNGTLLLGSRLGVKETGLGHGAAPRQGPAAIYWDWVGVDPLVPTPIARDKGVRPPRRRAPR